MTDDMRKLEHVAGTIGVDRLGECVLECPRCRSHYTPNGQQPTRCPVCGTRPDEVVEDG